jgi:hypothetical protein
MYRKKFQNVMFFLAQNMLGSRRFVEVFMLASFLIVVANSYSHYHQPDCKHKENVYYCPKVGGLESRCRPIRDCSVWHDLVQATPGTACKLSDGYPGSCCPDLPYNCIIHN